MERSWIDPACRPTAGRPRVAPYRSRWAAGPFALLCAVVLTASAGAGDEIDVAASGDIEEIRIVYPPPAARTTPLPREAFDSGRARNLSEAVESVPGVSGVKRGASGFEPVVRGLGWERVPVLVGGLPIKGAGPGRMDTPSSFFGSGAIRRVQIVKGLPSVTLGPAGLGGQIVVDLDSERSADSGAEIEGVASSTYTSVRDGYSGLLSASGGRGDLDYAVALEGHRVRDFDSGGGVDVPGGSNVVTGSLALGHRPAEGQRFSLAYVDSNYWDVDYPSLAMDSERGGLRLVSASHRIESEEGVFRGVTLRGGYAGARHAMNNERRASFSMMKMYIDGDADSFAASLATHWLFAERLALRVGGDFRYLIRDARRLRVMMGSMRVTDSLWPNVHQWGVGFYAEGESELAEALTLRVGARFDHVDADARDADGSGFTGGSVRDTYVAFYGAGAADVARRDELGSANLLLEWKPWAALALHVGGGVGMRAPAVTERYVSYAVSPGGFTIGNPQIDPELGTEVELGASYHGEYFDVSLQAYHRHFEDYILPTLVATSPSLIRGYTNVRARLHGFEASGSLRPLEFLTIPVSFAYVRGRNTEDGRDLPEIPAFEARVALRVEAGDRRPWWAEIGGRFVARQDRIDAAFGENETGAYQVLHLRGGIEVYQGVSLELGIENLLDTDYSEHLTREAPQAVGELTAGSEVPEPGIGAYLTARYAF